MPVRKYLSMLGHLPWAFQRFSPARRDAARRALCWEFLKGQADTITFSRDGLVWSGSVRSTITASLFKQGGYQQEHFGPLIHWLAENHGHWADSRTVINVGGNIGDTCVLLARQTGKRLIVCEPMPETFQLLQHNVNVNGLQDYISCHRVAISATAGRVEMICPREPGNSEVRNAQGAQGFGAAQAIHQVAEAPAVTLDALVQSEGVFPAEVGLVWSDTQGYEGEVIASGASLWGAGVPLWVELWPRGLEAHGGVTKFLDLCRRYFTRFLPADALLARGNAADVQAVQGLDRLVRSLTANSFTDILLLP